MGKRKWRGKDMTPLNEKDIKWNIRKDEKMETIKIGDIVRIVYVDGGNLDNMKVVHMSAGPGDMWELEYPEGHEHRFIFINPCASTLEGIIKIKDGDSDISELKIEQDNVARLQRELSAEIDQGFKLRAKLNSERDQFEAESIRQARTINNLKEQIGELERRLVKYKSEDKDSEIERMVKKINTLIARIGGLTDELNDTRGARDQLMREKSDLEDRLESEQEARNHSMADANSLGFEADGIRQALRIEKDNVARLQKELSKEIDKTFSLKEKWNEWLGSKSLRAAFQAVKEELDKTKEIRDALVTSKTFVEQQLKKERAARDRFEADANRLKVKVQNVEERLAELSNIGAENARKVIKIYRLETLLREWLRTPFYEEEEDYIDWIDVFRPKIEAELANLVDDNLLEILKEILDCYHDITLSGTDMPVFGAIKKLEKVLG